MAVVPCWKCGSACDPEKVPAYSKRLDMDGKFCPTCDAPLTEEAAVRFNAGSTQPAEVKRSLAACAAAFEKGE